MVRIIKGEERSDERDKATLVLMKPGVWYCTNDYAGCDPMPQPGNRIIGRLIESLAEKGYVESVPVFEGFMIEKHRITHEGIAWLAAH